MKKNGLPLFIALLALIIAPFIAGNAGAAPTPQGTGYCTAGTIVTSQIPTYGTACLIGTNCGSGGICTNNVCTAGTFASGCLTASDCGTGGACTTNSIGAINGTCTAGTISAVGRMCSSNSDCSSGGYNDGACNVMTEPNVGTNPGSAGTPKGTGYCVGGTSAGKTCSINGDCTGGGTCALAITSPTPFNSSSPAADSKTPTGSLSFSNQSVGVQPAGFTVKDYTVTVTGMASCGGGECYVTINFGDGSSYRAYTSSSYISSTHTYSSSGSGKYTITLSENAYSGPADGSGNPTTSVSWIVRVPQNASITGTVQAYLCSGGLNAGTICSSNKSCPNGSNGVPDGTYSICTLSPLARALITVTSANTVIDRNHNAYPLYSYAVLTSDGTKTDSSGNVLPVGQYSVDVAPSYVNGSSSSAAAAGVYTVTASIAAAGEVPFVAQTCTVDNGSGCQLSFNEAANTQPINTVQGTVTDGSGKCVGGTNAGTACTSNNQCTGGTCGNPLAGATIYINVVDTGTCSVNGGTTPGTCTGGLGSGFACLTNADCAGLDDGKALYAATTGSCPGATCGQYSVNVTPPSTSYTVSAVLPDYTFCPSNGATPHPVNAGDDQQVCPLSVTFTLSTSTVNFQAQPQISQPPSNYASCTGGVCAAGQRIGLSCSSTVQCPM